MTRNRARFRRTLVLAALSTLLSGYFFVANAADKRVSDISSTKHNLSSAGGQTTRASGSAGGTSEVCVFCHTPHGASTNPGQPLWNRSDSAASYTLYDSSTLDTQQLVSVAQPSEHSKLCLSCHDGTVAINSIGNMPGSGSNQDYIRMEGQADTSTPLTMPAGSGTTTGFTRNLGVDLSNDHPISFPYTTALASADGELRDPSVETHIGARSSSANPSYPLTGDNMHCTTCHDPHIKGNDNPNNTAEAGSNAKFLRGPRFQFTDPDTGGTTFQAGSFNATTGNTESGDIICLACHNRELNAEVWADSAHADSAVADETYTSAGSTQREFPSNIKVWQASCLNCHDTHSVQGSRRLLREGTDNASSPKAGGNAAQEETCFQCHTDGVAGTSILNLPTPTNPDYELVPNIKYEFTQRNYHMPLQMADQRNATSRGGTGEELHDITDADFSESKENLGYGNNQYRHAECTDCHNPHRLQRNSRFNKDGVDDGATATDLRTHISGLNETSTGDNDGREGNVASGVLRGAWGIDLTDPTTFKNSLAATWPESMDPTDFEVKSGDPGTRTVAEADTADNMTREYQLCFKCHSSYSQNMQTGTSAKNQTTIALTGQGGSTPSGTNGLTNYTNVAAEFLSVDATNPPTSGTDQGEITNGDTNSPCGGDCAPTATGPTGSGNHRSWHPVVFPTGRDSTERGTSELRNIRAPFADNVGTQTMHCSDCHGADGSWTQGSTPEATFVQGGQDRTKVQGPHGSNNTFLLRGSWNPSSNSPSSPGFCGNCHRPVTRNSGFNGTGDNVDAWHGFADKDGARCGMCHIAVPHGWKNKAFLVNLNCVGPEGGQSSACVQVANQGTGTGGYDNAPYYDNAKLKVLTWSRSGGWAAGNCGSSGGESGTQWMLNSCGQF